MAEAVSVYQKSAEHLVRHSPLWLADIRQQAALRFFSAGFPSPREEEWRYTNIAPIAQGFPLPDRPAVQDAAWIRSKLFADCWHLVLIDGQVAREFCHLPNSDKLCICDLSTALQKTPQWVAQSLGQAVDAKHGLIDFNTALFEDGAWIYLPSQARLSQPLQILHVQTQAAAVPTRHLIVLEEGACATVIETYAGTGAGLTVHVSEALLGPNSRLDHFKVQQAPDNAFHFSGLYVKQGSGSCLNQMQFALGSLLARSEIHARLSEHSRCELKGLHWANGRRHLDSHLLIVHAERSATSRQTYQAVAEEAGRSVFRGRILVQPGAQQTDAAMENKNLLLAETAEVDSKPQLEIYADDVQCRHGVSIGQLDQEALFYLQTRGIEPQAARELLIYGFVNALIAQVELASLRALLHQAVDRRFALLDLSLI